MIKQFDLYNFGPIGHLSVDGLQNINLLIGHNGSGKTFLLKALYAAQKSVEEYRRGKGPRTIKEIMRDKLFWVFQPGSLGEMVCKSSGIAGALSFSMKNENGESIMYSFTSSAARNIVSLTSTMSASGNNSIFIPAKEILSILDSIMLTSEGIKKVSILDSLLGSRYIKPGSVVFIDEIEANLHPEMISKFIDVICLLAKNGYIFLSRLTPISS